MNKRIRSRLLAASIVSTTLLGAGGFVFPSQSYAAQERPPAAEMLERGARLFEQRNYSEAKRILNDIDPAQLPENLRARRADLLTRTDMALAQSMGPNQRFDAAEQDRTAERFASAAAGYQGLIDDAAVPNDVKDRARLQLALVRRQQEDRAPQMRQLLDQASTLIDQNKLDEAASALATVQNVGGPLGWDQDNRLPTLQQRLAEKRTAAARVGTGAGAAIPGVAQGNPMDVMPGGVTPGVAPQGVPGSVGPMQEQILQDSIKRERALVLYESAKRASNEALAANQYQQAITSAEESVEIINENRAVLSDAEASAYLDAANSQLRLAQAQHEIYIRDRDRINNERTRELEAQRVASLQAERKRKVAALVSDAQKLYDTFQFKAAFDLLTQATVIDPQDVNAALMRRLVEDKIIDRDYEAIMRRTGHEVMRHNIDGAEHLIPYADLMVYPDNWPEITRKRVGGDTNQADSAANRQARGRLEESLKIIEADAQPLEKVLNYIRDNMGANLFVNWPALTLAGVDRNALVTVSLKEVPYRKALTTILAQVGGTSPLSYTIDDGIITISTVEDLSSQKYQIVRVYDIRDMLVAPNTNRQAPRLSLNSQGGGNTGGGGGGFGGGGGGFGGGGGGFGGGGQGGGGFGGGGQGGGGGLFQDSQTQNQDTRTTQEQRDELVTNLMNTIRATVAPDTWRDTEDETGTVIGTGTIGSMRELNGQLIVNQTVDSQVEVFNLLQQLRETRAIQIAIEARMLLVSNNFLDDFRIGWNLSIPAGLIGGNVGALSVGNLGTVANAAPRDTGVPGSISSIAATPSLNLSASIIDNWTLSLLLNATQADRRTITVTAPRVTLFNGQPGYIVVSNQQNYVASFNQTAAAGGIGGNATQATQLNVAQLNTGVVLDVTATVSADRRYVVMTINPQLSTLDGIDTYTISSAAGSNTTSGNNTTAALGGAFIQLPKISFTEVSTMVSIPDGGTLLIGGQKLIGEAEVEVGVPVLSKIPGIQRIFTNRSYVKDERTLLVLVRPNIIIHREIENDLFGVGYDRQAVPTGGPEAPTMSPAGGL